MCCGRFTVGGGMWLFLLPLLQYVLEALCYLTLTVPSHLVHNPFMGGGHCVETYFGLFYILPGEEEEWWPHEGLVLYTWQQW